MQKCAECGYLAVLHRVTGEYISAGEQFRSRGNIPSGNGYIHDALPFCAEMCVDFKELIGPRNPDNEGGPRAKVLNEPRDCDKFVVWNPCFSPKEHKQMVLEAEQKAWLERREAAVAQDRHKQEELQAERDRAAAIYQSERDKENRNFQAEQARLSGDRAERSEKLTGRSHLISFASVVVSLVSVSIAAYSATKSKEPQIPMSVKVEIPQLKSLLTNSK